MTPDRRVYAASIPWRRRDGRREWVVVTARTPLIRHYFDHGALGDHVRWWLSPDRPDSMRREVFGERVLVRGPWPFGLRLIDGPELHFLRASFTAELLGWALALWALWTTIKERR